MPALIVELKDGSKWRTVATVQLEDVASPNGKGFSWMIRLLGAVIRIVGRVRLIEDE